MQIRSLDFPTFLVAVAVMFVLSSCGTEAATAFDVENKEAFLAACTDRDTDGLLQQRVCQCVFDVVEESMPFERFLEINELLADDPTAPMPDDLLEVVAGCVVEEADL